MKTLTTLIVIAFSLVSFAGPGHGHSHGPVDSCKKLVTKDLENSSIEIGKCHISRLVTAGKIDKSWGQASIAQNKEVPKKSEWLITFKNDKGVKGKELFIFLRRNGGFIAANFTGK